MSSSNPTPGLPRTSNDINQHPYYMNGKIIITALILLFVIVLFIVAFHIYAKVFWRRTRWRHNQNLHETSPARGLDRAIIESLPIFTYKTVLLDVGDGAPEAGAGIVECAVCLAEFQENNTCRLLPKCRHTFHTDCIDMWFLSNTTCPLCRTSAEPGDSDKVLTESSVACLLPHHAINGHSEEAISGGAITGSHVGHRREGSGSRLARTFSTRASEGYEIVNDSMVNDGTRRDGIAQPEGLWCIEGEAPVRQQNILGARRWRRSVSDRFPNVSNQGVQFPTSVLFWGNHSHVNSFSNLDHWQIGGRSLPHIVIDIPCLQGSFHASCCASSGASQCFSAGDIQPDNMPSVPRPFSRLNSLKRFLSRERKSGLSEHGTADSCAGSCELS